MRKGSGLALAAGILVAGTLAPALGDQAPDRATTAQLTVRLLSAQRSLARGQPIDLGIEFTLADRWHVYWRNAGDSGEPPRVDWNLPAGFVAGEIQWPAPERVRTGPLVNYAYAEHVLLPVRVDVPRELSEKIATLGAKVRWLVCRAEECIPGQANLSIELPIGHAAVDDERNAALFAEALARLPKARAAILDATSAQGSHVSVRVPGLRVDPSREVSFFALAPGLVAHESARADVGGADLTLRLRKGELAPATFERLSGVLVVEPPSDGAKRDAFLVDASAVHAAGVSLALALVLAFAGGALLNLMPCVFPVLSLKVLGFVEQAGADARRIRLHGWAFTAGVVASFMALAGALIALRAGGESLGWGFQLQSPAFLAGLCSLLLLLALSLSGVFEIGMSLTAVTSARIEGSRGYTASFWTGALATVIATPCTAPFMGTALGYALTQPSMIALGIFAVLGLGMASPYLALSYAPGLLRRLPRPGAWMESFRQLMAFPLYATVMWLLYVFSRQTSIDGMWRLMTALLLLALGAWAWGLTQRSRRRMPIAVALAASAAAVVVALSAVATPRSSSDGEAIVQTERFWQPWSPERVEEFRRDGRPVFVNFTADWCLSCKVNERLVFATDDVRELFREHDVTALKADWTNDDARITEALAAFGRDGVPLYVFYPAGGASPRILPQVPTHGTLREAFATASASPQQRAIKEKNES